VPVRECKARKLAIAGVHRGGFDDEVLPAREAQEKQGASVPTATQRQEACANPDMATPRKTRYSGRLIRLAIGLTICSSRSGLGGSGMQGNDRWVRALGEFPQAGMLQREGAPAL
jgi:hypothetical protein